MKVQVVGIFWVRTPQQLFFKEKNNPSLLQPGTKVKFKRITKNEFM